MTRSPRPLLHLLLPGLLLVLAGCGTTGPSTDPAAIDGRDRQQTLTVLAAASLTEPFTALAERFEAAHPGTEVRLAFDSSATLATQAAAGAPADVLATADAQTMQTAVDAGVTSGPPRDFATNTLVLVVPAGNPRGLDSFADLDEPGVSYVACVESAPCGALARALLDQNRIQAAPRSLEVDVKAVLTRVQLDEADAGLVYASDAVAAGDRVRELPVPGADREATRYLLAPLEQATAPDLAAAWTELVLSEEGQQVLRGAGFAGPDR